MDLSTIFPKNPALTPIINPKKLAIKELPTPIAKESLPPSKTLCKRSLPSLSVPKGCKKDGGSKISFALKLFTESKKREGPKKESKKIEIKINNEIFGSRFFTLL